MMDAGRSAESILRPVANTVYPAAANPIATPRPTPRDAPVTSAACMELTRLLIEPEHVPSGIAKTGGDFRCVCADRLHDLPTICSQLVEGRRDAVHHDVNEESRR